MATVPSALYRRYRPDSFADVIGQEHVTGPLKTALSTGRIHHAYLFSGPRGCGKTTSARILARCLNCQQGPTPTPCGECPSCLDLARGGPGSLDVVEIDAASHGGVDDARDLRERATFAPARDRFKVYVIDEAHMVTTQGFNALLKLVEEPPEHVMFVFATTEPEKVLSTIRSRTHHYPFRLVPSQQLADYLGTICEREQVDVGKGVLPLVVRAGAGSVRDSLSVLDQLIGGSGPEGVTYERAVSLLGYTDASLLDDVVEAFAAADGATVFKVVERVVESGQDPRRFVEDLLERLRDLVLVSALPDGGHGVLRGLPDDQLERMRGQAAHFGPTELSRAADVVNAALTDMTGATSPRLQLELLCARVLLPGTDATERGLGARVDRIERRLGVAATAASSEPSPAAAVPAPAPAVPAPASTERAPAAAEPAPVPAEPAPVPAESAPASAEPKPAPAAAATTPGGVDVEAVRRMWPDIVQSLSAMRRVTWTLVKDYAQVLSYDGRTLRLGFTTKATADRFKAGSHAELVAEALVRLLGVQARVEPVVTGDAGATTGEARRPSAPSSDPAQPPTVAGTARDRAESGVRQPPESPPAAPEPTGPAPDNSLPDEALPDEALPDDDDVDVPELVGPPVVEQILGGRVIDVQDADAAEGSGGRRRA